MENFGDKIKEMRKAKNLNIYDLSLRSGLSQVEISQIENSKRKPRMLTVKKIAEALECDFETLYHIIYK